MKFALSFYESNINEILKRCYDKVYEPFVNFVKIVNLKFVRINDLFTIPLFVINNPYVI